MEVESPGSGTRVRSLRTIGSTFGVSLLLAATSLMGGIVIARSLGPAGRGIIAVALAWSALAIDLALFGSRPATVYFVASTPDPAVRAGLWANVRRWSLLQAAAGAIIFIAIACYLQRTDLLTAAVAAAFTARVFVLVLTAHRSSYLQGSLALTAYNAVRGLIGAMPVLVFLALAAFEMLSPQSAAMGYLVGASVGAVISGLWVDARWRRRGVESIDIDWTLRRQYWKYSARSFIAILASKGNSQIDILGMSLIAVGPEVLGLYAAAATAALLPSLVGMSTGIVAFPRLAAERDPVARAAIASRMLLLTFVSTTVLSAVLVVVADGLVVAVYGGAFAPAAAIVRILAVGGLALSMSTLLSDVLRSVDRVNSISISEVLGVVVTLAGIASYPVHQSVLVLAAFAAAGFVVTALAMGLIAWRALSTSRSYS